MLTARPGRPGQSRQRRFRFLRHTRFGRDGAQEIAPGLRPSRPDGSLPHLWANLRLFRLCYTKLDRARFHVEVFPRIEGKRHFRNTEASFVGNPHGAVEQRASAALLQQVSLLDRCSPRSLRREFHFHGRMDIFPRSEAVRRFASHNYPAAAICVHRA